MIRPAMDITGRSRTPSQQRARWAALAAITVLTPRSIHCRTFPRIQLPPRSHSGSTPAALRAQTRCTAPLQPIQATTRQPCTWTWASRTAEEPPISGLSLGSVAKVRSEEHTSELQSHLNLVCRLLLEKKKNA